MNQIQPCDSDMTSMRQVWLEWCSLPLAPQASMSQSSGNTSRCHEIPFETLKLSPQGCAPHLAETAGAGSPGPPSCHHHACVVRRARRRPGHALGCHWHAVKSVRTTPSRSGVRIKNVLCEGLDSTPRHYGGRGGAEVGFCAARLDSDSSGRHCSEKNGQS